MGDRLSSCSLLDFKSSGCLFLQWRVLMPKDLVCLCKLNIHVQEHMRTLKCERTPTVHLGTLKLEIALGLKKLTSSRNLMAGCSLAVVMYLLILFWPDMSARLSLGLRARCNEKKIHLVIKPRSLCMYGRYRKISIFLATKIIISY